MFVSLYFVFTIDDLCLRSFINTLAVAFAPLPSVKCVGPREACRMKYHISIFYFQVLNGFLNQQSNSSDGHGWQAQGAAPGLHHAGRPHEPAVTQVIHTLDMLLRQFPVVEHCI